MMEMPKGRPPCGERPPGVMQYLVTNNYLLDLLAERSNCPADLCDRAGKALDLC